jgi:hypothetical protein
MDFMGKYEFGVIDNLLAQGLSEPHGFGERHVTIVVTMNEEHR